MLFKEPQLNFYLMLHNKLAEFTHSKIYIHPDLKAVQTKDNQVIADSSLRNHNGKIWIPTCFWIEV